ncbi:hypothetical protein BDV27DRAFT_34440 [Aspergillus caelatus]|uniref:Uncharacterized protein n=1 Tax=Aspergillus caelatus TaxID=61420 RepID=A0A5N6ZU15_9EURO|nr:uncharacterized protein BDV27DRAFT_34440 [Aspergillus caelatus]KAE8360888.1 hypothetical protein BDV27DRAFT_34440 [Aspergillus caelatus]
MCSAPTNVDISATFQVIEHKFLGQHIREYPKATTTSQEDPLSIIAKQYVPWDNLDPCPGAISIISAHANGIPKVSLEYQNVVKRIYLTNVSRRSTNRYGWRSTNQPRERDCSYGGYG